MNSAVQMNGGADMASCEEAEEYLRMPELRAGYVEALSLADAAMGRHQQHASYQVFDAGFGRQPQGAWHWGPVDSFKVRASATLFATAASKADDREVLAGCLQVLQHFTGDCVYTPGAEGSAGYVAGVDSQPIALQGPDLEVLRRCGVDLERIFAG